MFMKFEKLVRDFFREIKLNQNDSTEKSEIDFNLIARHLDNDLSEEDKIRVELFKKENPELAELLQPIEEQEKKESFVIPTETGKIFRITGLLKIVACLVLIVSGAFFVGKLNKKESVKKEQPYVYRGIHHSVIKKVTNELQKTTITNKTNKINFNKN